MSGDRAVRMASSRGRIIFKPAQRINAGPVALADLVRASRLVWFIGPGALVAVECSLRASLVSAGSADNHSAEALRPIARLFDDRLKPPSVTLLATCRSWEEVLSRLAVAHISPNVQTGSPDGYPA